MDVSRTVGNFDRKSEFSPCIYTLTIVNSHWHFAMAMVRYGAQKVELCSYHKP